MKLLDLLGSSAAVPRHSGLKYTPTTYSMVPEVLFPVYVSRGSQERIRQLYEPSARAGHRILL